MAISLDADTLLRKLRRKRLPRKALLSYTIYYLLERIHTEFIVKAEGGTDSLGLRWEPLTPSTLASRPLRRGDIGKLGIGGRKERAFKRRTRGLLTSNQDARWRGIFKSTFERLSVELGDFEAKRRAAQLAWAIMKRDGAQTKLATLGTRDLPIMIHTGRLLASLAPGTVEGDTYTPPNGDQVVTLTEDQVSIDIVVPYADEAHELRPLFPSNLNRWVMDAAREAARKVAQ